MKKTICGILVICMCLLFVACGSGQEEAERAALDYINKHYCATSGDEVDSVEKLGDSSYTISCAVEQDYKFWKSTGFVKMSVYEDAGEWAVDVLEENIEYDFASNDNWYYIATSGNREFLIKMIAFNDSEVTLEYYGYDMGSYGGPDDYDHETITEDLKYDGVNRCFTFVFMGDWRIYGSNIKFNKYEVGAHYEYYQSGEFKTLNPVNPDDYWWFEKAVNATKEETPTTPDVQIEYVEISNDDVSGEMLSDQYKVSYAYVAKTTGVHCVQFTSDANNADFSYELNTTRLNRDKHTFAQDSMFSVYLEEGETLTITVYYSGQLCTYKLCVIEPNPIEEIEGTSFGDQILFESQENRYTYVAPKTGVYSFALDIDHVDKDYTLEIADTRGKLIAKTTYSQADAKVYETNLLAYLEEGMTYVISVGHKYKFPQYSVTITEPKPERTLSETAIEDWFEFWGEKDSFVYIPTQSGTFTFSFAIDRDYADYYIKIVSSKGVELYNSRFNMLSFGRNEATIDLELNDGEIYTITIEQEVSLCGYSVAVAPS